MSTLLMTMIVPFVLFQQNDVQKFEEEMRRSEPSERFYRGVTRLRGLQDVPRTNVYGVFNDDSTKFVAIVIKDSTPIANGTGWYYNMRAVHGVSLNMKMYMAPQVFASQDTSREGAMSTVAQHVGRNYGSIVFWSTGMFAPATSEIAHDADVAAALKKYPKWGVFPAWVIKQAAPEY
ncbi:MAG: hypothetical protein JSS89_06475 [Bacteroidetes bacterium]|nr:hypothetical protein [Bacteroidota bacterium]